MTDVPNVRPLTSDELYLLRQLIKNFSDVSPEELAEMKKLVHSGKFVRTLAIIIGKTLMYAGGAVGAFAAIKQFLWKGGG